MITIFPCVSRTSKEGVIWHRKFPATSGRGAGDPKLAQTFAYGKWLHPYRMLMHGASDMDQRCLETRDSEDGCTSPPNIFAPTAKFPQNPILWDLFVQTLLWRELSVSRTLMEKIYPPESMRGRRAP